MHATEEHHPLCTIELIADGHGERCPGDVCAFWERGCVLQRVESELYARPDVARLLLDLRREIETGRAVTVEEARVRLSHILNVEEGIEPDDDELPAHGGPAGGGVTPV